MLPDIKAEDRLAAIAAAELRAHARVVLISRGANTERAVLLPAKPRPAGAEARGRRFSEFRFEIIKRAELLFDRRREIARRLLATARSDGFPEQRVVRVTAAVVADCRAFVVRDGGKISEKLADTFVLETRALQRVVELIDIRLVVLVVVDFHRLRVDVGFERVEGIA